MSNSTPCGAVNGITLALILAALLPVAVQAADRAASAQKPPAKSPAANPVKPPAARRLASLTPQTPLSDAVDLLRNSTTPPLNIIVLWKPLGEAGIYRDTPIGIDGCAGLRAKQYLEALVLSLSAGASTRLGYTVDKGVITLATTDALPAPKPRVRVYDISDLVAPPARYSLSSTGLSMGYGSLVGLAGGPAGYASYASTSANPGSSLSNRAGGTYRRTGPSPRSYRSR